MPKETNPGLRYSQDLFFLEKAFQISHKRAKALIDRLESQTRATSQTITVVLTHEQLGRYAAMRRCPVDLYNYWLAPNVREYEPEVEEDEEPETIELRPGRRTVP
jgi:hypothetical protein